MLCFCQGTIGSRGEHWSTPPALRPTPSVDFLPLPRVHVLSSKTLMPRFQFPHQLLHPRQVVEGTKPADVCKPLWLMCGPQEMSCICSSGPWSWQAHRCSREHLRLFLLCLMNTQVWGDWQKGNGAFRNISNSLL